MKREKLKREDTELLRKEVHRFAEREVRPAALELDKMDPADVAKKDSPYWQTFKKMKKLGYHKIVLPEELGGLGMDPLAGYAVLEELAWGSLGLATALGVDVLPFTFAAIFGTMRGSSRLMDELV